MKYLILFTLAIVMVNIIQTKTLSHKTKRRALKITPNKRALVISKNLTTSMIKVNISTLASQQLDIALGMGIDINDMSGNNFVQCFTPSYISTNKSTESDTSSSSLVTIKSLTDDSFFELTGSAALKVNMVVASMDGKAQIDAHSTTKKASKTGYVKSIYNKFIDSLDESKAAYYSMDNVNCPSTKKITHFVKRLTRGKRLEGKYTLESKSEDSSLQAKASLETKFMGITLNKQEQKQDLVDLRSNYNFHAEINAAGGPVVPSKINDIEEFLNGVQKWYDEAKNGDANLVPLSYELHPIAGQKQFGSRIREASRVQDLLLSKAKVQINEMTVYQSVLEQYLKYAPSEQSELTNRINALKSKIDQLVEAGKKQTITLGQINESRNDSLSRFLTDPYYIGHLSTIQLPTRRQRLHQRLQRRRLAFASGN